MVVEIFLLLFLLAGVVVRTLSDPASLSTLLAVVIAAIVLGVRGPRGTQQVRSRAFIGAAIFGAVFGIAMLLLSPLPVIAWQVIVVAGTALFFGVLTLLHRVRSTRKGDLP